jgi:hypothetical protein
LQQSVEPDAGSSLGGTTAIQVKDCWRVDRVSAIAVSEGQRNLIDNKHGIVHSMQYSAVNNALSRTANAASKGVEGARYVIV